MNAIAGGTPAPMSGAATGIEPPSAAARVIDAVVTCAGRWGIDKTTVDDVAREAGMSRATVYRLFPGGKPAMVEQATHREVDSLLRGVRDHVAAAASLEDALVELLAGGSRAVAEQPALVHMRAHQPSMLRAFLSFERLDALFLLASDAISAALHRFLDPPAAREAVVWAARLVVSHYVTPDPARPLADPEVARHLVRTHMLAGLGAALD